MFNSEAQAKAYDRPPPTHYKPNHVSVIFSFLISCLFILQRLTEPKEYRADMNLEKSPRTIPIKKNKDPGPTTYPVEKLKLESILSTVIKPKPHKIVYKKESKSPDGDLDRFIDLHKKAKKWVPPVTRYNYTAD